MRSKRMSHDLGAALGFVLLIAAITSADVTVFDDKDDFLAATGASPAHDPFPNLGEIPGGTAGMATYDDVTFSIAAPSTSFYVGSGSSFDWSPLLIGNEIAINDSENLNVDVVFPVQAIGFDFVEYSVPGYPGCANSPCFCEDSVFTVTLLLDESLVGSIEFEAANDVATFVGVEAAQAFDRIEIRETTGNCDDEYFGQFYVALVESTCDGDANGDGTVDPLDSGYVQARFGCEVGIGDSECVASDVNADGVVDPLDVGYVLARFGACS